MGCSQCHAVFHITNNFHLIWSAAEEQEETLIFKVTWYLLAWKLPALSAEIPNADHAVVSINNAADSNCSFQAIVTTTVSCNNHGKDFNRDVKLNYMRVWLCGGSMEVLPCSRVAHIERKKKPYNNNIGFYTKRNALRVAEVWMDDYKSHVYIAWNLPLENPGIDIGDVSERKALRKSLKCKNFQWYLDHVYPEMRRYNNTVAYGELRNNKAKDVCLDQGPQENHTAILYPCHGWGPQLARYTKEGFLHLGALGTTTLLPDTRCLVDNMKSRFPQLLDCEKVKSSLHKRWNFIQNGAILNKGTGRCLEVENRGMAGIDLILRSCTGQRWTIKNFIK
ncbi:hypothetical protein Q9233_002892 [Columba guinea]|nr:hypothetical protein Q9233_002892 [Columba guinea]